MEYTVDNGHTNLRRTRRFFRKHALIRRFMHASTQAREAAAMIYRSEVSSTHSQVRFVNQLSQLQVALTEISVAALTTEPELRDMARSLISLAKYHSQKMTGSIVGAMEVEAGDRSMCLTRS